MIIMFDIKTLDIKNFNLKPVYYIFICSSTFILGILFYLMYNEIIIIRWPSKEIYQSPHNLSIRKKIFKITYTKDNTEHTEEKELIYSDNKIQTLTYIISSWLNILDTEYITHKKTNIQAVMLDSSGTELYISFDRNFLPKQASIYQKLTLIESLIKTLREADFNIINIRFLVDHKPLNDKHMDFSYPWPISGYINQQK